MTIGIDEIAGTDLEAEDFDGMAVIHEMGVAVRERDAGSEEREIHGPNRLHVAHAAIRDGGGATEGAQNGGVDFADGGGRPIARFGTVVGGVGLLEVDVFGLDHGDARQRKGFDGGPPIGGLRVDTAADGRTIGVDAAGGGEADRAWKSAGDGMQAGLGITFIAQPHAEGFDGVSDGAGVELTDSVECLAGNRHGRA